MRRVAFVLIASWMALALLVCPVIAKACPAGPASQRPAKLRRLSCDGLGGDYSHRPLDSCQDSLINLTGTPFASTVKRSRDYWMLSSAPRIDSGLAESSRCIDAVHAANCTSARVAPLRC